MKYVIIELIAAYPVDEEGRSKAPSEMAPPLWISSLQRKLDYFTCARTRTAKNFFGN